jgi:hypothetical protein
MARGLDRELLSFLQELICVWNSTREIDVAAKTVHIPVVHNRRRGNAKLIRNAEYRNWTLRVFTTAKTGPQTPEYPYYKD